MTLMDSYFPMAIGPGANSGMDRWRIMGRRWHPTGVILGVSSELTPSFNAGTGQLIFAPGAAWIEGFYCDRIGNTSISGVVGPGIAVLRLDPAANDVRIVWRAGVTAPDQSPIGIYEMPLVSISAANVMTDLRSVVGGSGGRTAGMRGPITQVDCAPAGTNLVALTFTAMRSRRYEITAFARGFGANATLTSSGFELQTNLPYLGNPPIVQNFNLGGNQWLVGSVAGMEYPQTADTETRATLTIRGSGSGGANGTLRVVANSCFILVKDIGSV